MEKILPYPWLMDWISTRHLPMVLSGASIKFFRGGLPAAVLLIPPEEFRHMEEHMAGGDIFPALNPEQVRSSAREWKIITEIPGREEEFHFILRPDSERPGSLSPSSPAEYNDRAEPEYESDPGNPEITLDRLRFDRDGGRWTGAPEYLADLDEGRIRLMEGARLDTSGVLQLCSLAARLDFSLASETLEMARATFRKEEAEAIGRRILQKHLRKIITGARPSRGFLALQEVGALEWFLPELAAGQGLQQNRFHKFDIFYHSLFTCDAVPVPDLALRLSALIHDLGKVETRRLKSNGEATFHNHEIVSARHAESILRRFGFPPHLIRQVKFLVRNHMFHYTSEWSDRAVRRFTRKVTPDTLEDLITLRLADRKGSGKRQDLPRAIKELMLHIEEVRAQEAELKIRDLKIDGHKLMEMGMEAGRAMGDLLKNLLSRVKSGELENEEGVLEREARLWIQENPKEPEDSGDP